MKPRILLQQTNPYGTLAALVEDDGSSVHLYLYRLGGERNAPTGVISVWVANRVPAPDELDLAAMAEGTTALMPAAGTRHPKGSSAFNPDELSFIWFETGDAVALMERGELLAAVPPWADVGGCPGYAREAIGENMLAWGLEEAPRLLRVLIDEAREYWEWRCTPQSWTDIQSAGLRHLEARLGKQQGCWDASDHYPPRAVAHFRPPWHPGVSIYSTIGMSAQCMPRVVLALKDGHEHCRAELVLAHEGPSQLRAGMIAGMTDTPWKRCSWLGDGHTYSWLPRSSAPGGSAVLLLRNPPPEFEDRLRRRNPVSAPDLSGLIDRSGDPVNYLWVVPITADECDLAKAQGSDAVVEELQRAGRGWVWR